MILISVWLAASAVFGVQDPNTEQMPQFGAPIEIAATDNVDELCVGDDLSLSPSGRYLAAWTDGMPRLAVFPTDCLLGQSSCRGWTLQVLSNLSGLVWSERDEVYLVPGDGPVRTLNPTSGALQMSVAPASELPDDVRLLGVLDAETPAGSFRGVRNNDGYSLTGLYLGGQGHDASYINRSTHRLSVLLAEGRWKATSIAARWTTNPAPVRDEGGSLYLVGPGMVQPAFKRTGVSFASALYQPRPIIDASTGVLAGAFDDLAVRTLGNQVIVPGSLENIDHIDDVAWASHADLVAVRAEDQSGRSSIALKDDFGRTRTLRCPATQTRNSLPATTSRTENWGTRQRPLMVRRRLISGEAVGTAIVWPGGPGGSFASGASHASEETWLRRGFNVATVDGSGSQGVDLGRRLQKDGFAALLRDARDAADALSDSDIAGTRLVVSGGSFGAVAAAEMAHQLALRTPDRPPALLLVVPWLRYRSPDEYNVGTGRERTNSDFLARSDAAAFGNLPEFSRRMDAWRTSFSYPGPVFAVFAAGDRITRPEDMWPSASDAVQTEVTVIPGVDHRFVLAPATARAAIEEWIAKGSPADAEPF